MKIQIMEPFSKILNAACQFVSIKSCSWRLEGKNFGLYDGHLLESRFWNVPQGVELSG